jgi:hypothetical protein
MVKIPQNIFSIPEPYTEEEEAPPLRVECEGPQQEEERQCDESLDP